MDQRAAPPSSVLRSWLGELHEQGFRDVRTGAVHIEQEAPFVALKFATAQRLTLLHRSMPESRRRWRLRSGPIRQARAGELDSLAELDSSAFPAGWGLDAAAITDAATATPHHRISVIDGPDSRPVGYAISGRAGEAAFLQRLAVAPTAQHQGLGRSLVSDCLQWATRWRVHTVAVNTQHDNARALELYESMGFVRRPVGLSVMERTLDGGW